MGVVWVDSGRLRFSFGLAFSAGRAGQHSALASCDAAAMVTCLGCLFLRVRGHEDGILLYSLYPYYLKNHIKKPLF